MKTKTEERRFKDREDLKRRRKGMTRERRNERRDK